LRGGMAFGLMVSFAKIEESTRELSIKDSIETFRHNIDALYYLEENGFSVQHLLHYLNKLFQIKSDYTKNLEENGKLKVQMHEKTASLAQMDSL
ncbi:hypothetical protein BAE44_0000456, partial [Dichanthelium oligosanthes]